MSSVYIVLMILMVLLNLFSIYLAVIALNLFKKHVPFPHADPATRFAVVIPARNEANVLCHLIAALNAQEYPSGLVDIYVAANHCTDDTVATARRLGAEVIECSDDVRIKGDVLHQAIAALMPRAYDAYAFFDADNLPAPDFLQRINDAFAAGETVCKGRLKAGNASASWVAGDYGLYHALMEWTYSRPHTAAGFSSNLVGTAFAVRREVFEEMGGWNTVTICEDSEFAAQCTRMGHRVCFVPEALSYDEQVTGFGTSLRQRRRWCYGMVQAARRMTASMFSPDNPRPAMARDFGMLFIISHTAPLAMLVMLLSLPFQPKAMWLGMGGSLVLSWVGMTLLGLLLCPLGGYPLKEMKGAVLLHPLFMASWVPLQVMALFWPVKQWTPIAHMGQADVAGSIPASKADGA